MIFLQFVMEGKYIGANNPIIPIKVKKSDFKTLRFASDPDGRVHSCITVNGKDYRCRSEMLVLKDGQVFALKLEHGEKKDGKPYIIPGGSLEEGLSVEDNAAKETKEEAALLVNNIKYTGVTYAVIYTEGNINKHFNYIGGITFVCTGEFSGKYAGKINMDDTEPEMLERGDFYDPGDIEWIKFHIEALQTAGITV